MNRKNGEWGKGTGFYVIDDCFSPESPGESRKALMLIKLLKTAGKQPLSLQAKAKIKDKIFESLEVEMMATVLKLKENKQIRILVVDDEDLLRRLFFRVLETEGYAVETAANGLEAVEKIESGEFDIIFMDIVMPGMNGVDALREIKKRVPNIKAIMMTGYSLEEKKQEALSLGALKCMSKPFGIKDITDTVHQIEEAKLIS